MHAVLGEERHLLQILVPGLRRCQVQTVGSFEISLVLGVVEEVRPVEQAHGIVVERQHVGDAIDLADQVHQLRDVYGGIDLVGSDALVERRQPASLGEFADPIEIDHDRRVASLRRHELRHQLGVHLGIVDDLEIDVDAGLGLSNSGSSVLTYSVSGTPSMRMLTVSAAAELAIAPARKVPIIKCLIISNLPIRPMIVERLSLEGAK